MPGTTDEGGSLRVDELFGLLGNDLRMRIVRALWEEFDFEGYVTDALDPIPFSVLLERTGIDDSGNFNYHLGRLGDVLVEHRDGGYVLTPLGFNLMHAIDTYATFEYETVLPTEIDDACPFCGDSLVVSYERELVHVRCPGCGGLGGDGNVQFVKVPATGVQRLGHRAMLDVATLVLESRVRSSLHGFCWGCRSRIDRTVFVCEEHEPGSDGHCEHCDGRFESFLKVNCGNCGLSGAGPLLEYALVTPAVQGFLAQHGENPDEDGPWRSRLRALNALTETVVSTDPIEVAFEFAVGENVLQVVVRDDDGIAVAVDAT